MGLDGGLHKMGGSPSHHGFQYEFMVIHDLDDFGDQQRVVNFVKKNCLVVPRGLNGRMGDGIQNQSGWWFDYSMDNNG